MARPLVATELYLPGGAPSDTTNRVYRDATSGLLAFNGIVVSRLQKLYTATGTTNTSGGAANIDSFAISGLTSKDTLVVLAAYSDPGATISTYSATDSTTIANIGSNTLPGMGAQFIGIDGTNTTKYASRAFYGSTTTATYASMATAFTGSWTLALRTTGAGSAALNWQWWIWKLVG